MIFSAALAPPAKAGTLCQFQHVATIALHNNDYTISTQGIINGHNLSFLVDTGSEGSLLTPEALTLFDLVPDPLLKTIISGPDGKGHVVPGTTVSSLMVGGLHLDNVIFPVGEIPGAPLLHPPLLGLIGMDVLGRYDLDFDLPHNRLSFWEVRSDSLLCKHPPDWSGLTPVTTIRSLDARREGRRFMIPFMLDGHKGTALLDSGARSHIVSLSFVHKIGLSDEALAQDPGGYSAGIGSRERRYQWHKFQQLRIGHEVTNTPTLTIAPMDSHADMLLGADWFTTHHIWISNADGQIYLHP
ncbi:retroviral-like aspartic protease family protein [Acetobacteraceae bacterium ESL0709]|nr:retroviral-like aspartic protease family protein [Acetobacteraceae bacterium ESL0709]